MAEPMLSASRPRVLDVYLLPKVAFVLITVASAAGAVLTGWRHGWFAWGALTLRWGAYWLLALLVGSAMWRHLYLVPSVRSRPRPAAVAYAAAMLRLHRRWEQPLLPLAAALAAGVLGVHWLQGADPVTLAWLAAAAGALVLALLGAIWDWRQPLTTAGQSAGGWLKLLGLAAAVAAMGGLDVVLVYRFNLGILVPNRMLHLLAFSAWLGGAFWNIFIAVPTGTRRTDMDSVILANFQLERFRAVVRIVFPTIVLTGLLQTWAVIGRNWQFLFNNWWGYLVTLKAMLLAGLVVVFITCPMWRACSPIRGVCNLDDLEDDLDDGR